MSAAHGVLRPRLAGTPLRVERPSPSFGRATLGVVALLLACVVGPALALSRSVDENSPVDTNIGTTLKGVGDFHSSYVTWSIDAGDSGGLFKFGTGGNVGRLQVKVASLNYEGTAQYTLTITGQNATKSHTEAVTVNINDVNESPSLAGATFSIDENSVVDTAVGTALNAGFTDPDNSGVANGQINSFAIQNGNGDGYFKIDGTTGQLKINALGPNHEADAQYVLTVRVTDKGSPAKTADATVTINVNDVNENPTLADATLNVNENVVAGTDVGSAFTFSDPDNSLETFGQLKATGGWTIQGTSNQFEIGESTGQIKVKSGAVLNHEATPQYTITVRVTDKGNLFTDATITININDVNEDPILADATVSVPENSVAATNVGSAFSFSDPDASNEDFGTLATSNGWTIQGTSNEFTIGASTGQIKVKSGAVLNHEATPQYTITVRVTDKGGAFTDATITVDITDVNEAATLDGATFAIDENSAVDTNVGTRLDAGWSDPDDPSEANGQIDNFAITAGNVDNYFKINTLTGLLSIKTLGPNHEADSQYVLTVRATDKGSSAKTVTATITINVNDVNENPILADATLNIDENTAAGTNVGSAFSFSDPDNSGETFGQLKATGGWTIQGTSNEFEIGELTGQIKVKSGAVLNHEATPQYTITVRVTDKGNAFTDATITIDIDDVNEAPSLTGATFSIDENSAVNTVVGTRLDAGFSDPDASNEPFGQIDNFAIQGGNNDDYFKIDGTTGQLMIKTLGPNHEADAQYVLTVRVTDKGSPAKTADATVTINVNDVNEDPTFSAATINVNENAAAGTDVGSAFAFVDPDDSNVAFGELKATGGWTIQGTSNEFEIGESSGQIKVKSGAVLNHEATPQYAVTVRVTDKGNAYTEATITIDINDLDEDPIFADATLNVNENVVAGTDVGSAFTFSDPDNSGEAFGQLKATGGWTIQGTSNEFEIGESTGQIKVKSGAVLNHEATPQYTITVRVTDKGNAFTDATITIDINDLNEKPIFADATVSVDENEAAGTNVGSAFTFSDPDNSAEDFGKLATSGGWTIQGTSNEFEIGESTGQIKVKSGAVLNHEATPSFDLTVRCTDKGGAFRDATITVDINDVNESPLLSDATKSVNENSVANTVVGSALVFADPDNSAETFGQLKAAGGWTIQGTSDEFTIDESSGQIKVKSGAVLNHEATPQYTITVRVTDKGNAFTDATITIDINDLNEVPVFADATVSVDENVAAGTNVSSAFSFSDPDNSGETFGQLKATGGWTIQGTSNQFEIGELTGQIKVKSGAVLNHEATPQYTITVRVTDRGNEFTEATITIDINDVNENPALGAATLNVNENVGADTNVGSAFTFSDPDNSAEDFGKLATSGGWTIQGTSNEFKIGESSGQIQVKSGAVLNHEATPQYTITVRVTDKGGVFTEATITIDITDLNEAPSLEDDTFAINENSAVDVSVGTRLDAGFSDPDASDEAFGQIKSFEITGGNDDNYFKINSVTGLLQMNAVGPNHEADDQYVLTVRVTDKGSPALTADATITINVNDLNENPVFADATLNVDENVGVGTNVSSAFVFSDPDNSNEDFGKLATSGGWTIQGTSNEFEIGESTGQIQVKAAVLNHEATLQYTITVRVTDKGGVFTEATITIDINDVNEQPTLTDQTFNVPENSDVSTTVGSSLKSVAYSDPDDSDVANGQVAAFTIRTGNGAGHFSIVGSTGQIQVASAAIDFESISSYTLVVRITDDGSSPLFDEATITINVVDGNEAPVVTGATLYVDENAPSGTEIGSPISAFDVDKPTLLTFSIAAGNDTLFNIDSATGQLSVGVPEVQHELNGKRASHELTVRATDNGTVPLYGEALVVINVNDLDEGPVFVFTSVNGVKTVPENSALSTAVGLPVQATDQDFNANLTYAIQSISADGATFLGIHPTTGQIFVKTAPPPPLNYESVLAYSLVVNVTDDTLLSSEAAVAVSVVNVNDVPIAYSNAGHIEENTPVMANVTCPTDPCVWAYDEDADALHVYSILGGNAADVFTVRTGHRDPAIDPFGISTECVMYVGSATIDYETKGSYSLLVQVKDNHGATDSATTEVIILDVNEAPVVVDTAVTILETVVPKDPVADLAPQVSDVDANSAFHYELVGGNEDGEFAVDTWTGALTVASYAINYERKDEYVLTIDVTDSDNSDTQNGNITVPLTVTVTIENVNEPPSVYDVELAVEENSAAGVLLGEADDHRTPLRVNATDPDGLDKPNGLLTFTITAGDDDGEFDIDAGTGQISVKTDTLNFERKRYYELTVRVEDSGSPTLSDTATVVVRVLDINDQPTLEDEPYFLVNENSPVSTPVNETLQWTDQDGSRQNITFSIIAGNDLGHFGVDAASGQVFVAMDALNHEFKESYTLTLRAADNGTMHEYGWYPAMFADATVHIFVEDVNEAPLIADQVRHVDENSAATTPVGAPIPASELDQVGGWAIIRFRITAGNSRDALEIDDVTGQISVAQGILDYEDEEKVFSLTVQAYDLGTPSLTTDATVTVNVVDINDAPVIADTTRDVDENRKIQVYVGARIPWFDQDTAIHNDTVEFSLVSDTSAATGVGGEGFFGIRNLTGQIFVRDPQLNFEGLANVYTLVVLVRDTSFGGYARLDDSATVVVSVRDLNDAPVVVSGSYSVDENSAVGTAIGQVAASDEDAGQSLRYVISDGNEEGLFAIDAATGDLSVATADIDFERRDLYELNVTVWDDDADKPAPTSAVQTVEVLDRNDAPVITTEVLLFKENEDVGALTLQPVMATDEDTAGTPQVLTFQPLELVYAPQNATAKFAINASGYVSLVNGTANFEDGYHYEYLVTVIDSHAPGAPAPPLLPLNQQVSRVVRIDIVDVNERALITLVDKVSTRLEVEEGVPVGTLVSGFFEIIDPDAQTLNLTVQTRDPDTSELRRAEWFSFNNATSDVLPGSTKRPYVQLMVIKANMPNSFQTLLLTAEDPTNPARSSPMFTVNMDVADTNDVPVLPVYEFLINENSPAGTVIGRLQAFDNDPNQEVTYTVRTPLDDYFDTEPVAQPLVDNPNQNTKELPDPLNRWADLVLKADALDFEVQREYVVSLELKDDGVLNSVNDLGERFLNPGAPRSAVYTVKIIVADVPDRPVLTDVAAVSTIGLTTSGGEEIRLIGSNMGSSIPAGPNKAIDIKVTYTNGNVTFQAADCQVRPGDDYVKTVCQSVAGFGYGFKWRIERAGQASDWLQDNVRYAPPNVAAFRNGDGVTTAGNTRVTIVGTQFGEAAAHTVTGVTYGPTGREYTATDCAVTLDHEELQCTTAPGVGRGLLWIVGIGNQSSLTPVTTYGVPAISAVSGPGSVHANTEGGQEVILDGVNFGTNDEPTGPAVDTVRYGKVTNETSVLQPLNRGAAWLTAQNCTVTVPHKQVKCLTAEGVGTDLHWQITVAGQLSAISPGQSDYGAPFIAAVTVEGDADGIAGDTPVGPTAGAVKVTITGHNFGGRGAERVVTFGHYLINLELVAHLSHTELQFTLPAGNGVGKPVQVSVDGQLSGIEELDYSAPTIGSLEHISGSAGELVNIRVVGRNFGSCCYKLHRNYLAAVAAGPAAEAAFKQARRPCECTGDVNSVTVVMVDDEECTIVDASVAPYTETTIDCLTNRTTGDVVVTTGGLSSDPFPYRYIDLLDIPFIENVHFERPSVVPGDPAVQSIKPRTTGEDVAVITGSNFGEAGLVLLSQRNQETHVTVTRPVNPYAYGDKEIRFKFPPGLGKVDLRVSIMGNTRESSIKTVDYQAPTVTQVTPRHGPTSGATLVTLRGYNFGPNPAQSTTFVLAKHWASAARLAAGDTNSSDPLDLYSRVVLEFGDSSRDCVVQTWSQEQITCLSPVGYGTEHNVEVRVSALCADLQRCNPMYASYNAGRQLGTPGKFGYDAPQLASVSPTTGPTVGGTLITLTGTSFSTAGGPAVTVFMGPRGADSASLKQLFEIVRHDHNLIELIMIPGVGVGRTFTVQVAGLTNNATVSVPEFSYEPPVVHSVVSVQALSLHTVAVQTACAPGRVCVSDPFDAVSAELVITGANFGSTSDPNAQIFVGGVRCNPPNGASGVWQNTGELRCQPRNVRVGNKSVLVRIAEQETTVPATAGLVAECKAGFWGLDGGFCQPCPAEGAYCLGGPHLPQALEGYYFYETAFTGGGAGGGGGAGVANISAQLAGGAGGVAFTFVPCRPVESCLKDNQCLVGYTGDGCLQCVPGQYFRDVFSGTCEQCPDRAYILILAYFFGGLVVGLIFYKIYKKGPSVAALGIAVDYFQVLSVFADLQLSWPVELQTFWKFASVTAANVEVTSPECSISVTYAQKWYFFEGVPIMFALVLCMAHIVLFLKKLLTCRKGSRTKHVAAMLGVFLVSLNYLFLLLTRKAFEVFNCKTEGNVERLVADPEVLCSGPEYEELHAAATAAVIVYGFGIPLLYAVIIFRNSAAIKVDQGLRAKGLSGSRASNPYYDMQKRYRRLYFKFKPDTYYWNVVILARKFSIVFMSMMVRDKPMFAASTTMLILFFNFVVHQKKLPYRTHNPEDTDPYFERLKSGSLDQHGNPRQKRSSLAVLADRAMVNPGAANDMANMDMDDSSEDSEVREMELADREIRKQLAQQAAEAPKGANHSNLVHLLDEQARLKREGRGTGRGRTGSAESRLNPKSDRDDSDSSDVDAVERRKQHREDYAKAVQKGKSERQLKTQGSASSDRGRRGGLLKNVGMRVEARDKGGPKIKLKYLYDYNSLEATFLTCAIFVLLSGIMFGSSEGLSDAARAGLKWLVLTIVVLSTVVCVTTVLLELASSLKYYKVAKKARRKMEKKRKDAKNARRKRLSVAAPALANTKDGVELTALDRRRLALVTTATRQTMTESLGAELKVGSGVAKHFARFTNKIAGKGPQKGVKVNKMTNSARYEMLVRVIGVSHLADVAVDTPLRVAFKLDVRTHKEDFPHRLDSDERRKGRDPNDHRRYVAEFAFDTFQPTKDVVHVTIKMMTRIKRILGTSSFTVGEKVRTTARDMKIPLADDEGLHHGELWVNIRLAPKAPARVDNWSARRPTGAAAAVMSSWTGASPAKGSPRRLTELPEVNPAMLSPTAAGVSSATPGPAFEAARSALSRRESRAAKSNHNRAERIARVLGKRMSTALGIGGGGGDGGGGGAAASGDDGGRGAGRTRGTDGKFHVHNPMLHAGIPEDAAFDADSAGGGGDASGAGAGAGAGAGSGKSSGGTPPKSATGSGVPTDAGGAFVMANPMAVAEDSQISSGDDDEREGKADPAAARREQAAGAMAAATKAAERARRATSVALGKITGALRGELAAEGTVGRADAKKGGPDASALVAPIVPTAGDFVVKNPLQRRAAAGSAGSGAAGGVVPTTSALRRGGARQRGDGGGGGGGGGGGAAGSGASARLPAGRMAGDSAGATAIAAAAVAPKAGSAARRARMSQVRGRARGGRTSFAPARISGAPRTISEEDAAL